MNNYRAIWISDIHLGTKVAKTSHLLNFLKHNYAKKIFLVGDILDGWELSKKWYWPKSHNQVLSAFLKKAKKKSAIVYIPGNHDMFLREFSSHLKFSNIVVKKEAFYITKKNKKIWITHGDQFDSVRNISQLMHKFGDTIYSLIILISEQVTRWRNKKNLDHWSFASHIKNKSKGVKKYIDDFKQFMISEAKTRNCDGVICGHIHQPEIKKIGNTTYYNDGDWVENLSALVETNEGDLKIIYWKKII